jgi:hypothetical protein
MRRTIFAVPAALAGTAVVFLMLIVALPTTAQPINPCTNDFQQYCSDVTPGGGRLIRCYEVNKTKMSADCIGWAEGAKADAAVLKAACGDMIDARCSFEKGDPLAVLNCLQSNYIDLSVNCRVKLNAFKNMYTPPAQ